MGFHQRTQTQPLICQWKGNVSCNGTCSCNDGARDIFKCLTELIELDDMVCSAVLSTKCLVKDHLSCDHFSLTRSKPGSTLRARQFYIWSITC